MIRWRIAQDRSNQCEYCSTARRKIVDCERGNRQAPSVEIFIEQVGLQPHRGYVIRDFVAHGKDEVLG